MKGQAVDSGLTAPLDRCIHSIQIVNDQVGVNLCCCPILRILLSYGLEASVSRFVVDIQELNVKISRYRQPHHFAIAAYEDPLCSINHHLFAVVVQESSNILPVPFIS